MPGFLDVIQFQLLNVTILLFSGSITWTYFLAKLVAEIQHQPICHNTINSLWRFWLHCALYLALLSNQVFKSWDDRIAASIEILLSTSYLPYIPYPKDEYIGRHRHPYQQFWINFIKVLASLWTTWLYCQNKCLQVEMIKLQHQLKSSLEVCNCNNMNH